MLLISLSSIECSDASISAAKFLIDSGTSGRKAAITENISCHSI